MMPIVYKFDHFDESATRQELHEIAVSFAEEQFSRLGRADFMWIIASGPHVVWIKTNWDDDEEKLCTVHFLRQLMQHTQATCYASIQEAWMARANTDEEAKQRFEGGLRNLSKDQKDDVLLVWSFDRNEQFAMTRYLVTVREPRGLNFLGPRDDLSQQGTSFEGRMWNLLLPEKRSATRHGVTR